MICSDSFGFSVFLSSVSLRHVIVFAVSLKLAFCISIRNEDGCPYTFDMGNKGYDYIKPQSCFTLLPENFTAPPVNLTQQNNGSSWGEPNPNAPYTLRIMYTPKKDTFAVRVDSVDPTVPIYEVFVEVRRISRMGKLGKRIGYFEPAADYEGFCCEDSKLQGMFHRPSMAGLSTSTTSVRWVPLRFPSGEVIIRANIFASAEDWYANITSRRYVFPGWTVFMRERTERYTLIADTIAIATPDKRGRKLAG